jgi:hypothetical protein
MEAEEKEETMMIILLPTYNQEMELLSKEVTEDMEVVTEEEGEEPLPWEEEPEEMEIKLM